MPSSQRPLRIAWLIYRGNPHCGGQGVYTRYLAREVTELGHHIEVLSGQPWPELDDPSQLVKIPSLDLYRPGNPFRVPWPWEFRDRIDLQEFAIMCAAGFPEPYTFSLRARNLLAPRRHDFDLIHDNQCLGTGLLGMMDDGWPIVATLHHPITVDRDLDMEHATIAVEAGDAAALVRVPRDADEGRAADPAPRHRERELAARHRRADGRARGPAAHRARRRGPGELPSAAARRARPGPHS